MTLSGNGIAGQVKLWTKDYPLLTERMYNRTFRCLYKDA